MLGPNDVKEQLSVAYVHAVAARAGCSVERVGMDRDSIDLKVCARGLLAENAALTSPELGIQLKATARVAHLGQEGGFPFALSRKNYNDLVAPSLVPRILVVFVMPEAEESWLTQTPESLVLRHCAYWTSLRGQPRTLNDTGQTVRLSRERCFTHDTLRRLLEKVAREEELES